MVRVVPHRRRANAQRDGYAYPQLVGRIGRVEECLETTVNALPPGSPGGILRLKRFGALSLNLSDFDGKRA